MKLNIDCMRDILLIIEEEQVMRKIDKAYLDEEGVVDTGTVKSMYHSELLSHEKLNTYSSDDIFYSIKQLGESGLLDINDGIYYDCQQTFEILDITPYGHEFISNLRSKSVWEKVKATIKNVNGASIPIIAKVAAETLLKQLLL